MQGCLIAVKHIIEVCQKFLFSTLLQVEYFRKTNLDFTTDDFSNQKLKEVGRRKISAWNKSVFGLHQL